MELQIRCLDETTEQAPVPVLVRGLPPCPFQPWPLFGICRCRIRSCSLRIACIVRTRDKPAITLVLARLDRINQVLLFITSPFSAAQNATTSIVRGHRGSDQSTIAFNNLVGPRRPRGPCLQVNVLEICLNICLPGRSPRVLGVIGQVSAVMLHDEREVDGTIFAMQTGKSIVGPKLSVFRRTICKWRSLIWIFEVQCS
jgi:hypothetical protein